MPDKYKINFMDNLERFNSNGNHECVGKTFETIGLKKKGTDFPLKYPAQLGDQK